MKIVASNNIQVEYIQGILYVLTKYGHSCIVWDKTKKPFFDMLDEQKPDILFINHNEQEYLDHIDRKLKTVLIGQTEKKCDLQILPSYYANTVKYLNRKKYHQYYNYACVYFSDYDINRDQFEILRYISDLGVKFGIFGKVRLPLYEYLGEVTDIEKATLINNCAVGVDFNGWNFLDFAYAGKLCLTTFNNPLFFPVTLENIKELVDNAENIRKINDTKEYIIENKLTDYDLTFKIFSELGIKIG